MYLEVTLRKIRYAYNKEDTIIANVQISYDFFVFYYFVEAMFKDVFHSLDIWHKAKSIKKCISKVGSTKGMEKIKKWSEHIIRHFWYCCSTVSQIEPQNDEVALGQMKEMWISVLHHVCDQHEWLCGKCSHGELTSEGHGLIDVIRTLKHSRL